MLDHRHERIERVGNRLLAGQPPQAHLFQNLAHDPPALRGTPTSRTRIRPSCVCIYLSPTGRRRSAASVARFSNCVNCEMNDNRTVPCGPFRCFPMITSAIPLLSSRFG
jgi:hypothetical protein